MVSQACGERFYLAHMAHVEPQQFLDHYNSTLSRLDQVNRVPLHLQYPEIQIVWLTMRMPDDHAQN